MNIQSITPHILLECLSGSRAYGLDTPESDTDIRGIFTLTQDQLYGFDQPPQISNETQDITYFELRRTLELLEKNNPAILELLFSPPDCIRKRHPVMDLLDPKAFLSQKCKDSFAGYAYSQIRKAKGLNKKINQPQEPQRKTVLDCCYIAEGGKSVPCLKWLAAKGWEQADCGLVNLPRMPNLFALYYDPLQPFKGIVKDPETANDVALSSVPKDLKPVAYLSFNHDLYKKTCREYKDYWAWVEQRNQQRFQDTTSANKNYDAKNMMHTFRLLDLAEDIATDQTLHIRSRNRDFLLAIRAGAFGYEELLNKARAKVERLETLFMHANLPAAPDANMLKTLLPAMRKTYFKSGE